MHKNPPPQRSVKIQERFGWILNKHFTFTNTVLTFGMMIKTQFSWKTSNDRIGTRSAARTVRGDYFEQNKFFMISFFQYWNETNINLYWRRILLLLTMNYNRVKKEPFRNRETLFEYVSTTFHRIPNDPKTKNGFNEMLRNFHK